MTNKFLSTFFHLLEDKNSMRMKKRFNGIQVWLPKSLKYDLFVTIIRWSLMHCRSNLTSEDQNDMIDHIIKSLPVIEEKDMIDISKDEMIKALHSWDENVNLKNNNEDICRGNADLNQKAKLARLYLNDNYYDEIHNGTILPIDNSIYYGLKRKAGLLFCNVFKKQRNK